MRYQKQHAELDEIVTELIAPLPAKRKEIPAYMAPVAIHPQDLLSEVEFRLRWYRERKAFAKDAEEIRRLNGWLPILERRRLELLDDLRKSLGK